jgi:hypothetical protein
MPDREKTYIGIIEHDEASFKPRAFVNYLAGYLGWQIVQAIKVDTTGRESATMKLAKSYGAQSVELTITARDVGTSQQSSAKPVLRVELTAAFDDAADWHDRLSEELVARTMKEMDEAIWKLTTYKNIWRRKTGYWRNGALRYQCPDAPGAEPETASSSGPTSGGLLQYGNRRNIAAAVCGIIAFLCYSSYPLLTFIFIALGGFFIFGDKSADRLLDALAQLVSSKTPDRPA